MKEINSIVSAFAFSLIALLNISAQETTFDVGTLSELKANSAKMMEGKKMRVVTVEERLEDEGKTSVIYSKSIREVLPPDRAHYLYETRTARGTERDEYIDIGKKSFVRRNDGEWEILVPSGGGVGSGNGNGSGDIPKTETNTVRTLIKNVKINNQGVDQYKIVDTVKFIYPTRTYTNVYTETYWFDNAGRMIKSASEAQYGDTKIVTRTAEDYEYNPNFKIEEPRIKKRVSK